MGVLGQQDHQVNLDNLALMATLELKGKRVLLDQLVSLEHQDCQVKLVWQGL